MDNADSKPPTPEEISKKLADFMKSNFGSSVVFSPFQQSSGATADAEDEDDTPSDGHRGQSIFDFDYLPKDIKKHLDRFVIKQDEAKKVLSLAVCDHYNRAKYLKRLEKESPEKLESVEFAKQNVVILGPTGVGKTYLVKHIADLIGVPFIKADATKFSETGYVGGDVDDLIRDLVRRADGDVGLAEYGIIYIDEIDKLATRDNMMGRDVSGRGVQTALLKLMEETEVPARNPMDIQSQMQALFDMRSGKGPSKDTINTRHILFIVSGAFTGLGDIISKRIGAASIGFDATPASSKPQSERLFRKVHTEDFIKYGFEAEFVGRLPIRVVCDPLEAADLCEIMENSEGSLIRQYEREFEAYGVQARFERSALEQIAERAAQEKTGARGLMTVCENILRDFKFELAGSGVPELVVDARLVNDPGAVLQELLANRLDSAEEETLREIQSFTRAFEEASGVKLLFTGEAVSEIRTLSDTQKKTPAALCQELFHDYQFGLKLILKNTGRDTFELPADAVRKPDRFLSELVMKSYQSSDWKD